MQGQIQDLEMRGIACKSHVGGGGGLGITLRQKKLSLDISRYTLCWDIVYGMYSQFDVIVG